jgi:hypothetical protein
MTKGHTLEEFPKSCRLEEVKLPACKSIQFSHKNLIRQNKTRKSHLTIKRWKTKSRYSPQVIYATLFGPIAVELNTAERSAGGGVPSGSVEIKSEG